MPNHLIIAVGGTGQVILHYYTLLYLVRAVEEPFDAVVVDSDTVNEGLGVFRQFFELLQFGHDKGAGIASRRVPSIDYLRFDIHGHTEVSEVLTGKRADDLPGGHPAKAFFDHHALIQDISKGLFGQPALSPVLAGERLSAERIPLPYGQTTAIVVSSLIGGTGGGLTVPLIDRALKMRDQDAGINLQLRGVLFGEYFKPKPEKMDPAYQKSNLRLCLESFKEDRIRGALNFFCVVGDAANGEFMPDRPSEDEKDKPPAWPSYDKHPFWRGTQALAYLLRENIRAIPSDFYQRQVATEEAATLSGVDRKVAKDQSLLGLSRAQALVSNKVVECIAADPFRSAVWDRSLVKLVADFWGIGGKYLGEDRTEHFPARLQTALRDLWEGESGLRGCFPTEFIRKEASLRSFRKVRWPEIEPGSESAALFKNEDDALRRTAATLLFETLRSTDRP